MIRLYDRDANGQLHYHEAWTEETRIVEHWGAVGSVGETTYHPYKRNGDETAALERVLAHARELGFGEISDEEMYTFIITYSVAESSQVTEVKQDQVSHLLDNSLGWTGLGHTSGYHIGDEVMEIYCVVVDFELARQVVIEDLRETEHDDYLRIYDEESEFSHIPRVQS